MQMKDQRYRLVTYLVIAMESRSQAPQKVCHETSLDLVHSLLSILADLAVLLLLDNNKRCDVNLQLQRLLVELQELLSCCVLGSGPYL